MVAVKIFYIIPVAKNNERLLYFMDVQVAGASGRFPFQPFPIARLSVRKNGLQCLRCLKITFRRAMGSESLLPGEMLK